MRRRALNAIVEAPVLSRHNLCCSLQETPHIIPCLKKNYTDRKG